MGPFLKEDHQGKGRRGALGPGPSRPGLGFGGLGPTLPSRCRPRCLGEGARVHPSPLYKERALGEESTQLIHEHLLRLAAALHLAAGHLSTSPSHSTWPPEGLCRREGSHHHCTLSCCGVSGFMYNTIYFPQSWLDQGFKESSWSPYVCVRGGVRVIAPRSSSTLRLAMSSSSSMLVRERNPCVRSTRVRVRTSVYCYNITNR
jgi:hypothetical protein